MASSSKNKGKSGERELSKILSEIFEAPFQRVFSSGAFVGGKNAYRREILSETTVRSSKGDIIPPDNMSKMVIECKSYKDFPFWKFLRNEDIPILEDKKTGWIPQTLDAIDEGDIPFIAFKINNKGWFLILWEVVFSETQSDNFIKWKSYKIVDLQSFLIQNKEKIKDLCKK